MIGGQSTAGSYMFVDADRLTLDPAILSVECAYDDHLRLVLTNRPLADKRGWTYTRT